MDFRRRGSGRGTGGRGAGRKRPGPGVEHGPVLRARRQQAVRDHRQRPAIPGQEPESRRYRFSAGDELVFSSRLLDKQGGTNVGRLYVKATVVSGKTFADIKALGSGVFELTDGSQIH